MLPRGCTMSVRTLCTVPGSSTSWIDPRSVYSWHFYAQIVLGRIIPPFLNMNCPQFIGLSIFPRVYGDCTIQWIHMIAFLRSVILVATSQDVHCNFQRVFLAKSDAVLFTAWFLSMINCTNLFLGLVLSEYVPIQAAHLRFSCISQVSLLHIK
jgi:hypothetical protein